MQKMKAPTDKLKESTVSKHDVDGCCERHLHDSDSDYSDYDDASSIDLYDENEFLDENHEKGLLWFVHQKSLGLPCSTCFY